MTKTFASLGLILFLSSAAACAQTTIVSEPAKLVPEAVADTAPVATPDTQSVPPSDPTIETPVNVPSEPVAPPPAEIPIEVEYQFLRLADILAGSITPEEVDALARYASRDPQFSDVDLSLLAGAIDLSADQTALQSDPRLVVSAGLYLLSVGHRNDIGSRLDALVSQEPRLSAFDLSLMEEAVLVRWNILDALQSIEAIEATDIYDSVPEDGAVESFEAGTQELHRDYRFAVFSDEVDRLSEEHLSELEYTLKTYVLGISREVDQDTVTSSIRRVDDLNAAAREQANETMRRTLRAIFGYGY